MLLGVCRLWGAGFVVQGTRLAVLCLRARVLGVCGAWVWCGGASCPVLLWGWVRVRVLRACAFSCCGLGWGVCCRVLGRCALVWPVWCPAGGVLVGAAVGGLVVICIVDASIFVLCVARAAPPPGCVGVWSVVLLVFGWVCVLFFWAFGGCLGIRGR